MRADGSRQGLRGWIDFSDFSFSRALRFCVYIVDRALNVNLRQGEVVISNEKCYVDPNMTEI